MTPDAYTVIGHPVAHSLSPRIHAAFAAATGEAVSYTTTDVLPGGLAAFLASREACALAGANVTLPHKEAAFTVATSLSARARDAGAVNTLLLRDDGTWSGDNTDGVGLRRDLSETLGWPLGGRLLVLGAGGAVRGILGPLLAAGPRSVTVANRTVARAQALAARFAVEAVALDGVGGEYEAVINALSVGHAGGFPDLPGISLAPGAWAYDLSYGAAATPFLRWASARGAGAVADGLGMLVAQAAESFYLWRKVRPEVAPVLSALRQRID